MGELSDTNPLFPGDNETETLYLIQKVIFLYAHREINLWKCKNNLRVISKWRIMLNINVIYISLIWFSYGVYSYIHTF